MPLKNSSRRTVLASAAAAPPPLPVPALRQDQDQWCWAACIVMALRYYGDGATQQCQLAAELTGKNRCCADPQDCDSPCTSGDIQPLYQKVGLLTTPSSGVPAFGELTAEFAAKRPVEIATVENGAGHALIVTWAGVLDGEPHARLNDPEPPATVLWPYSELTSKGIASWAGIEIDQGVV